MKTRILFFVVAMLVVPTSLSTTECVFPDFLHRGDANCSGGEPNLTDVIVLNNFIQFGGPAPCCIELADVNGDTLLTLADVRDLFLYLFGGCGCMATPHCLLCEN